MKQRERCPALLKAPMQPSGEANLAASQRIKTRARE